MMNALSTLQRAPRVGECSNNVYGEVTAGEAMARQIGETSTGTLIEAQSS
jgi:hypothetical protein